MLCLFDLLVEFLEIFTVIFTPEIYIKVKSTLLKKFL